MDHVNQCHTYPCPVLPTAESPSKTVRLASFNVPFRRSAFFSTFRVGLARPLPLIVPWIELRVIGRLTHVRFEEQESGCWSRVAANAVDTGQRALPEGGKGCYFVGSVKAIDNAAGVDVILHRWGI